MSHASSYKPGSAIEKWFDDRLPIARMMHDQFRAFPTPRNLNYLWTFGGILTFCLALQMATGIVLAMHYVPHESLAFDSVEHIMRDVNWGWLLRYMHANGSSMFFVAVYVHIARGMYYGSYKAPREILWILGVFIFLAMMATAFMGYSLVWGQMSFWAVTVITNLFSSLDSIIPGMGTGIVEWIWGGFAVGNPTLNRLFSLHYLLPFVIAGLVLLHIWALHVPGSNNPTGINIKTKSDSVSFHPYYTIKDGFAISVFVFVFAAFVFYAPNYMGHTDNYIQANPLATPPHIVPEWYFLPYYAILRAVPDIVIPFTGIVLINAKLAGVIAMFGSILLLVFLPWLDTSPVKSARYRPIYKWCFLAFFIATMMLGYMGAKPAEGVYLIISRVCSAYYFLHLLVILPLVGKIEKPTQMPGSITDDVLGRKG